MAPDFSGKLPGRGAWVTATREAVEAAVKKRAFSRALKASASASNDLGARVDEGLAKGALSALGLARRTGDLVTGFEKVRSALKTHKAAALIAASDGAEDGRRKLAALAGDATVIALFDRASLSAAVGCDVVHGALSHGAGATRFLSAARRLERYRGAHEEGEGNGAGA